MSLIPAVVLPSPLRGGIEGGGRVDTHEATPTPTPPLKGEGTPRSAQEQCHV